MRIRGREVYGSQSGRAPKAVPHAMLVLLVGAAVVDDDVADRHDAGRLQRLVQLDQLLLGPVLARQVVQLAGQVPLRRTQCQSTLRQEYQPS